MDDLSLLTAEQVAEAIGGHVKAWTITAARRRKELAATKVGKRLLFRIEDVEAWLNSQRTSVTPAGAIKARPTPLSAARRSRRPS